MNNQVENCYSKMGGNYQDAVRRFETDARVIKYLKMMRADTSFASLHSALEQGEYDAAFRAAHTLKGVALNLSLTRLAAAAGQLTEELRAAQAGVDLSLLIAETEAAYQQMCRCIDELLENTGEEGVENEGARKNPNCG